MADAITIDLETGKGYAGLGDIVMLAWLAEGCRRVGQEVHIHRTRDLELMAMFGLTVEPEPGGVKLDEAYGAELADRGRRPRLDYVREFLGITAQPARPPVHIADADRAWAADRARELGSPLVALFPQTAWTTRQWPAAYWVDVAWALKAAGVPAVVLLSDEDKRFTNTPQFWWGTPVGRLAALLQASALAVGNDSFPAHLAGTLGVRTLAVLGPTRPTVFAHVPDVTCLASAALTCTGCHFGTPFRAACDQGCLSLFRLFPEDLLKPILRAVGRLPARA